MQEPRVLRRAEQVLQLCSELGRFRHALVADLERLWDKHRISLTRIEGARQTATEQLDRYLREPTYA
jgi:hypothetical protein